MVNLLELQKMKLLAIKYLECKLKYYISSFNGMIIEFKLEKFKSIYQNTQDDVIYQLNKNYSTKQI